MQASFEISTAINHRCELYRNSDKAIIVILNRHYLSSSSTVYFDLQMILDLYVIQIETS